MAGPEKPIPRFLDVHNSFGPSLGQPLSRPVSLETPVRSGPRHCGQSAAPARAQTARLRMTTKMVFMRILEGLAESGRGRQVLSIKYRSGRCCCQAQVKREEIGLTSC